VLCLRHLSVVLFTLAKFKKHHRLKCDKDFFSFKEATGFTENLFILKPLIFTRKKNYFLNIFLIELSLIISATSSKSSTSSARSAKATQSWSPSWTKTWPTRHQLKSCRYNRKRLLNPLPVFRSLSVSPPPYLLSSLSLSLCFTFFAFHFLSVCPFISPPPFRNSLFLLLQLTYWSIFFTMQPWWLSVHMTISLRICPKSSSRELVLQRKSGCLFL